MPGRLYDGVSCHVSHAYVSIDPGESKAEASSGLVRSGLIRWAELWRFPSVAGCILGISSWRSEGMVGGFEPGSDAATGICGF